MSQSDRNLVYESGQWQVHLGRRELLAGGVPVPIGGRAFEIIEVLVRSANELVTKDDLMDRIWPGAIVRENTLQVHISAIRKALGPDRSDAEDRFRPRLSPARQLDGPASRDRDAIRSASSKYAPRKQSPPPISPPRSRASLAGRRPRSDCATLSPPIAW